jgi:glutathionylspermidine synthase
VLGGWLVDGQPAGLGVRESAGPITSNTARFLPHLFQA